VASGDRRWGLRPLELQLAAVLGVIWAGLGAFLSGTDASVLARVGLAMVSLPVGAILGLRTGDLYLDGGPALRGFCHVSAYLAAVVLFEAVASGGAARVDGLMAAALFVPILFLVGRNLLAQRGARRLGLHLIALGIAASNLVAVVQLEGGVSQTIALLGLTGLLGLAAALDMGSRRRRIAAGEIAPPPSVIATGWSLWLRLAGSFCALAIALGLLLTPIERDNTACGSLRQALELEDDHPCAAEARFTAFGGFASLVIAGAFLRGVARGRGPASGRSRSPIDAS
jgi:hypothetical protein